MPNKDDNAVPAGGVDPATEGQDLYATFQEGLDVLDALPPTGARRVAFNPALAAAYGVDQDIHRVGFKAAVVTPHVKAYPAFCLPLHTSVELFGPASIFPGVDQDGEPIGSDDPFTDIGYGLPEDGHPRTRKTSNPKAKTRDHELHMKTVKELAQLDIGFFMHIDEKAGKATLRRPNCQTVIYLTHKSRWMLAGSRNRTTHGTVAEFATWYRNNIGVS